MTIAPKILPGHVNQRLNRVSRLLFHWRASDLSLTPLTGETPTFVRATGGGLVLDSRGYYRDVAQAQPRWDMSGYDAASGLWLTPRLRLEGQRVNLVAYNDALTAANGWTLTNAPTVAAGYSTLGKLSFTRVSGLDGSKDVRRVVGLTGNAVKAVSFVVRFDAAGTTKHSFYDSTAVAYCGAVMVTWAADGTATCVATTGTLLAFEALPGHAYRILMQATACTAANTHIVLPVDGGGTATSVQVGGVQVEDAAFPSNIIPTPAGGTVTRNADALSYPFLAPPQDLTVYTEIARPIYADVSGALGEYPKLFRMGGGDGASPHLTAYFSDSGASITTAIEDGVGSPGVSSATPAGTPIRHCGQYRNLTTAPQVRADVGAGFGGWSAAGAAFSAWNAPIIYLGQVWPLQASMLVFKVAAGLNGP